jgi:hypothetical protein
MLRVMPHTQTPNDSLETLSDQELITQLAEKIGGGVDSVIAELRAEQEITRKQLDHIDSMTHEILRFIEEHRPALNRALAFMEPGKGIRDYLKNRPKAGDK